jgi:hypothetical protein
MDNLSRHAQADDPDALITHGARVNPPIVPFAANFRDFLRKEIKSDQLLRALVVIGPLVISYFFLREPALLNLGLLAISLLIPALKLRLPPGSVGLHFLAILATFAALFFAFPIKPLFVALTALAAFLAVAVTRYGDALRTLGNWVFIPAVYLACEVREGASAPEALHHAGTIVLASPVALALVCGIQFIDQRRNDGAVPAHYGAVPTDWFLPAAATAMAVLAAAALVEVLNLAQGQWVIWSAASVVVGDLSASTGKLKLRAIGAFAGVPLGLLVGFALPESRIGYSFAVLGATLTLIAFERYVVGFGSRCFFIALAAAFAGGTSGIAEERVINVIIGGVFGLIAVALTELIRRRVAGKADGNVSKT